MSVSDERPRPRTLIVGVGNPILSDDGVGIHVARKLRDLGLESVDVEELPASGLELLDMVLGYDRVVIVDAIVTEEGRPGGFHVLEENAFERTVHGSTPHGINIATALAMGRKIVPEKMPKEVFFVAIEAKDIVNVSESMTPAVAAAIPSIVDRIVSEFVSDG
ncbi:MAG TPA: hydrogenase maturation protease [Thermoplasmata archaeon]|nr:hydrogenase maturation protease [Thermoplasmata archaeon]